ILGKKDNNKRAVILSQTISNEKISFIYQLLKKNHREITISFYSNEDWVVEGATNKSITIEQDITRVKPTVHNFEKYLKASPSIHKVLCIGPPENISHLKEVLQQIEPTLSINKSKDTYLEIVAPNVSKLNAIEVIASHYKTTLQETMAIGDHFNDLDMIQNAGVGVAMENGPDLVKETADIVTSSNNEDGLAQILNEYFR